MKRLKIFPLLILVAMLSFSVRMVGVIEGVQALSGSAQAEEAQPPAATAAPMPMEAPAVEPPALDPPAAPPQEAPPSASPAGAAPADWRAPADEDPGYASMRMEMFEDLNKRRAALEAREKALNAQEALLKAAEQELQTKYGELAALKKEIEDLLGKQSEEEQARAASLVKIYEGMKPKDAARIFDTLDLDILVGVASKMSERKLAPVIAAMNSERAQTLTTMLAEQKKLPALPPAE